MEEFTEEYISIEIKDVSAYLNYIKDIRNKSEFSNSSVQMFFRGQEDSSWPVEPSIFRKNMISIEHLLIQKSLQRNPFEFKNMTDTFEILTKLQHYGMCTRLLDVTTNPLVALFFACQKCKENDSIQICTDSNQEFEEKKGIVLFRQTYTTTPDDTYVRIISALTKMDLYKENDLMSICRKLYSERIIDKSKSESYQNEEFEKFLQIIQKNHFVSPDFSNERLIKQSGAFLLPGSFFVSVDHDKKKSLITKAKQNLREEFDVTQFVINEEDKEDLLKELDFYNINESTLFPELEHQLSYIKHYNSQYAREVAYFVKLNNLETDIKRVFEDIDENSVENILDDVFNEKLKAYGLSDELIIGIMDVLEKNSVVDWYKKEQVLSKIRLEWAELIASNLHKSKNDAKHQANQILDCALELLKNHE